MEGNQKSADGSFDRSGSIVDSRLVMHYGWWVMKGPRAASLLVDALSYSNTGADGCLDLPALIYTFNNSGIFFF